MSEVTKILVVDDEELACECLKTFLTNEGYEVECALSGKMGLEMFKNFQPHLILLDIRMPDIIGLDFLSMVKQLDQKVRIIMMTAIRDNSVSKAAYEKGADDFITKPIDFKFLTSSIRSLN